MLRKSMITAMSFSALLVGCSAANDAAQVQDDEDDPVLEEEARPSIESYRGDVTMYNAAGNETGTMTVLTRTRSFPAQNLIIEQTIQIDHADRDNPKEAITMITVDGDDMTLLELHDRFSGSGQFTEGTAWEWTKWETEVTLEEGMKAKQTVTKSDGSLAVAQELMTEAGDVEFTFTGDLDEISNAAFKRQYEELFPLDAADDDDDDDDDDD